MTTSVTLINRGPQPITVTLSDLPEDHVARKQEIAPGAFKDFLVYDTRSLLVEEVPHTKV